LRDRLRRARARREEAFFVNRNKINSIDQERYVRMVHSRFGRHERRPFFKLERAGWDDPKASFDRFAKQSENACGSHIKRMQTVR